MQSRLPNTPQAPDTILITGGARRIGLHCAERFVADGYRVIITCRQPRSALPEALEVMLADFSTTDGIQRFIDELQDRAPRLRAIIHNASLWMDDSEGASALQQMFMVHMQAPYLINQQCRNLFVPGAAADIIHLGDDVTRKGSARHIGYCATKTGLEGLTRSFAASLAPAVKVNAITPALIMFNPEDDADYRARALNKSALGIEPGPDVVYQSIRFLMDNPYITGSCLPLNGGRHLK
ncbi:MAG TPA: dihydromonapterin reductase [Pseudomonas sp.]|jgi:dihydromonapterin reductase/dihydrofolate reductase|uniref:dihydromonapterin reductase n=1 Tax=Halopseudomonas sp. TaxID=2901191 RepID=UPI000C8DEF20|nr:dihydromonapterin reductase [Pseudomonadales bacterium]MAK72762.1 dihydromonapterin reductase [Pseudomonadales bacterium]MCK5530104.1 dihydromonapterin reductase [Halopseudomonas aestusnigri]HBT56026.1 dihydromonapterin reductase [Pseudomonas sp.]HCP01962.1 dihydromonapterin reductase [Pseudomonas sp.]|tara:strand:+ start:1030 stop:1743 length:714 start_codon:yes stop_codon:yes gene_type:complete